MDRKVIQAIIKTLCYAEVFSYPLTFPELHTYLLSSKKISKRELLFGLNKNRHLFAEKRGFLTLRGSVQLVEKRIARMKESRLKLGKAITVSGILSHIPTIQLIGISGSLSMYNAKKEDDIDLFFITSKNTLWITRFFVILVLFLLGQKRKPGSVFAQDKICPNMFIAEDALGLTKRNIYVAHEVAQLKILYEKNYMKERFLRSNKWVLKYLPHAFSVTRNNMELNSSENKLLGILNVIFFGVQKLYMRKKMTREIVSINMAFFHPTNFEKSISEMYKLKKYYRKAVFGEENTQHILPQAAVN